MNKVFIVTAGTYSRLLRALCKPIPPHDYHIEAVFKNKEDAEEYVDKYNNCGGQYSLADVEEWDLEQTKKPLSWIVWSKPNSIEIDYAISCSNYSEKLKNKVRSHLREDGNPTYYSVYVHADTESKAIKIAADLFREYKALND